MGSSRKGRRAAARGNNAKAMLYIAFVVLALAVVLVIKGSTLKSRISTLKETQASLEEQIADEEARTKEILAYRDYLSSEDYIKQAAREKLGLVDDDDIVFIRREE